MNSAVAARRPGPFAVLRRRNFTLLWVGQLVSTMGTALAELAASILVYRLTGSAAAVGLMLIAAAGPSVVLGLIAFADIRQVFWYGRSSSSLGILVC